MREILFRGKRLDNGEWVEGSLAQAEDGDWILVFEYTFVMAGRPLSKTTSTHQVAPETVGQFTGLLDKNGTKIFEGDLFKWTSIDTDGSLMTQIDEVKWTSYGWVCGKELQYLAEYLEFDPSYENLELIGNIHEVTNERI